MLENKSLGAADDVVRVGRGRLEVVNLPGAVVSRAIFEPGWRWSEDAAPLRGTTSCREAHCGYVVSGRFRVRMDGGEECEFAAGDAHVVGPGHDAWVVGNEPVVMIDFAPIAHHHTETSDLHIPHDMFRRAFGDAAAVIGDVRGDDGERVALVAAYFDNVLRFLDAHHDGEDEVVWPLLQARCPAAAELLAQMAQDHAAVHAQREAAGAALAAWAASPDDATASRLVAALSTLSTTLDAHFAVEEAQIVPLASQHLSAAEWGGLPAHAMGHFTGDRMWLILGLVMEQMSEAERRHLPPPAVEMWNGGGSAAFADMIGRVRPGVAERAAVRG